MKAVCALNHLFTTCHKDDFKFKLASDEEVQTEEIGIQVDERELYIPPYEDFFRNNLNILLWRLKSEN